MILMPAGRACFAAGKSAGFTPLDLGAKLWAYYDPKTSIITGTANVTQITDLSGNARHLTATTGPALDTTYFGAGKPGLTFNGTTQLMKVTVSSGMGGTVLGAAAVAVLGSAIIAEGRLCAFTGSGGVNDWNSTLSGTLIHRNSSTNALYVYRNGSPLSGGSVSADTRFRVLSEYDSANHTLTINGSAQTPV